MIRELEGLAREKGKHAASARLGLLFAQKCEIIASSGQGTPDEQILMSAMDLQCGVVTNDRRLRDQVLDVGLPVVSPCRKTEIRVDSEIRECITGWN